MTTAVVVALLGLVPVVVAVHAAGARRQALDHRRRTVRALHHLTDTIDAPSTDAVARGLSDVLHLRGCRYEPDDPDDGLPAILDDGSLDAVVQHRDRSGIVLPERTVLACGAGRFVLLGDPGVGTTVEERLVAVAMAGLVAPQRQRHSGSRFSRNAARASAASSKPWRRAV